MRFLLLLLLIFLTACTPKSPLDVDATPQRLSLYVARATEEWIPLVYSCTDRTSGGLVSRTPNIADADISLRLTAPKDAQTPVYQIGEVELVIVGNAANPISALTRAQVLAIFEGKTHNWAEVGGEDAEIRLWVYGQDDDIQIAFNETLLEDGRLSSLAWQAQSPEEMQREIAGDANAIGIISRAQADENLHILHPIGKLPVLAILKEAPQGLISSLLSCLQGE